MSGFVVVGTGGTYERFGQVRERARHYRAAPGSPHYSHFTPDTRPACGAITGKLQTFPPGTAATCRNCLAKAKANPQHCEEL